MCDSVHFHEVLTKYKFPCYEMMASNLAIMSVGSDVAVKRTWAFHDSEWLTRYIWRVEDLKASVYREWRDRRYGEICGEWKDRMLKFIGRGRITGRLKIWSENVKSVTWETCGQTMGIILKKLKTGMWRELIHLAIIWPKYGKTVDVRPPV